MAQKQYLAYYINLPDKALVEQLQGTAGAGGAVGATIEAPYNPGPPEGGAAVAYGQQLTPPVVLPVIKDGQPFVSPSLTSPWFKSEYNFPLNVREFTRKSGGWFGISWLFGTTIKFYWRGIFVYAPSPVPVDPDTGTPAPDPPHIAIARFVDGFELPPTGEGGTSTGGEDVTREASRTPEGYGLAFRGMANKYKQRNLSEYTGSNPPKSWERFYAQLLQPDPGATVNIWRCNLTTSSLAGLMLDITSTGQFAVWNRSNAGVETLLATVGQLAVGVWTKIDLLLDFNQEASGGSARFRLFMNGVLTGDFSVASTSGGFGQNSSAHLSSFMGNSRSQTNKLEINLDDWKNANIPVDAATGLVEDLTGIDWQNGSHMILVRPDGFGAGHGAWVGNWRTLLQNPAAGAEATLVSATSGDRLEATTDADEVIAAYEGAIGAVAMVVAKYGNRGGTLNGTLGYKIGAAADVLAAITESGAVQWNSILHTIAAGKTTPDPLAPLKLLHEKAASVDTATVYSLLAVVEVIGTFGEEDIVKGSTPALEGRAYVRGPHNAPYPSSPWVRSATPPMAPVMILAGTYTGDSIGQDLIAKIPAQFVIIRPLTSDAGGVRWWTSMLAAHRGLQEGLRPMGLPQALVDPDFVGAGAEDEQETQALLRTAGAGAQNNASGVSYAYLIFCDPAMRFSVAGAFMHNSNIATADNPLIDPDFTPHAAWLQSEDVGTGTTARQWYKGPGHAAAGAQILNAAETANVLELLEGLLRTQTPIHLANGNGAAYIVFRRHDGSADPGAVRVVQIGSYVGNGSTTRTIALAPASGRRPLWAAVLGANGTSYIRDHAHTTNTSSPAAGGSTSSTAIIDGGIDEITVGITLNANGVTYNYFVFPGSALAGNGGWSEPGEFWPVDPTELPPGQGPWPGGPPGEPTFPPSGPTEPTEPPTLPPELPPEISGDCLPYTQEVGNLALSQIGHGREVADLETETTEEAYAIRRYYLQDVKTTLRDFPWPFATRYSTLTLVSGSPTTPVNRDWTYAYRTPGDCIFARRIVVDREGAVDPTPPPFQLSSDATVDGSGVHTGGALILTNEANAQLEYTAWPTCPARFGDVLFREACIWRLAASLAPSLSRIADRAAYCEARYQATIAKAWQVLRPGNPGTRPAASTIDTAPTAAAANVAVVNRALVRIGARTIANLTTEQSREAVAAALIFEAELRATLRDHPWAFATRYDEALTLVAGTLDAPVNADWTFSFRLASDCVFARRLARPGTGRRFDPSPDEFRTTTDATGGLLFCDLEEPVLEYTARLDGAVLLSDALFQDALAWRLAASLAPSLATVDPGAVEQRGRGPEPDLEQHPAPATKQSTRATRERAAQYAWAMYRAKLLEAKVADAREQQPPRGGDDADWILAR